MGNLNTKYRLTRAAEFDVESIIRKSTLDFGTEAARRYVRLLLVTFQEIAQNPEIDGSRQHDMNVSLYHLRYSSKRAAVDGITVRRPRHFVVYRHGSDNSIEIVRVLHDAMDLDAQLLDRDASGSH
jgi:toxin ParE1/3/4